MAFLIIESLMYFGILYGGYRYGAGKGAVLGTILGIVQTIRIKNLGALGIMSIMGMLAGMFSPLGKVASILGGFAGALGVGTLYAPTLLTNMIPWILMAGVGLFFMPAAYCVQSSVTKARKKPYTEDGSLSVKRLKEMACSLEVLSKSFKKTQEEEGKISSEDAALAFQTAASVVCKECKNCNLCKASSQKDNYYIYYLLQAFENNGILTKEDMPKLFIEACGKQDVFMDQINYSLGKAKSNLIWRSRFIESREMVATQFLELSNIMGDFSDRIGAVADITEEVEKKIKWALRTKRMHWEKLLVLEQENGRKEVFISAASMKGSCITAKELADAIGGILGCKFKPTRESKNVIHKEYGMIHLAEDTNYMVLHALSKTVKAGSDISGDNFAYCQLPEGRVLLGLSDGMGTGQKACRESEKVIELTEQLLETGFSMEAAAKMIHSVLLLENNEQQPTTLDLACIDLYSGVLEGMKFGASSTFIIHRDESGNRDVEIIEAENLPMGLLKEIDPISTVRYLAEGDMIVMVTDGVIEAFPGMDKEERVQEFLGELTTDNPGDLADALLDYACGQDEVPGDDMLILTVGIWKKQ